MEHEGHEGHKGHEAIAPWLEKVGREIVDAAFTVHTALGPGLLESAYEQCLTHELTLRGLKVVTQVPLPVSFKGLQLDVAYRIDLLVEDSVIVEVKSAEQSSRLFEAQVLTYLKFAKLRLGYLLNFNVAHMRQGVRRLVL